MRKGIYVFTFCKSGRHRSLANQRLLQFIVEDYGVPQWDLLLTSTSLGGTTAEEAALTAGGKLPAQRRRQWLALTLRESSGRKTQRS